MLKILIRFFMIAAAVISMAIAAALSACSAQPAASSASSQPSSLISLQKNRAFSASLSALVQFNDSGVDRSAPTQFSIPPVSITWMGKVFDGIVKNAGPLKDTTY
jgi:hypothetical protein